MGLDMYLTKKTYVKNWDHTPENERHKITVRQGSKIRKDIKPERISYIDEQVAYWRKANAVHKWFVDTVQGGKDECQTSYVTREQLQELVDLCKKVLAGTETVAGPVHHGTSYAAEGKTELYDPGQVVASPYLAEKLLPTQSGFFFGKTEYDEDYLQDLKDTVDMLEPVLAECGDGEFYYNASW